MQVAYPEPLIRHEAERPAYSGHKAVFDARSRRFVFLTKQHNPDDAPSGTHVGDSPPCCTRGSHGRLSRILQVVADYEGLSAVQAAGRAGRGRASGPQYLK
jgi:hypothetical protein